MHDAAVPDLSTTRKKIIDKIEDLSYELFALEATVGVLADPEMPTPWCSVFNHIRNTLSRIDEQLDDHVNALQRLEQEPC